MKKGIRQFTIEAAAILLSIIIFWIPFYFIIVNALKDAKESSLLNLEWPSKIHLWDNMKTVIEARDYMILRAFYNSTVLTVISIVVLIVICALAEFVINGDRIRRHRGSTSWCCQD